VRPFLRRFASTLREHPLPERARQCRERHRLLRPGRLPHVPAFEQIPFENSIQDMTHHLKCVNASLRCWIFPQIRPSLQPRTPLRCSRRAPRYGAGRGFHSISGGAVDRAGKLYFVNATRIGSIAGRRRMGSCRERSPAGSGESGLRSVRQSDGALLLGIGGDSILFPSRRPSGDSPFSPAADTARPDARAILPANYWNNGEFRKTKLISPRCDTGRWPRCLQRMSPRRRRGSMSRRTAASFFRPDSSSSRVRPMHRLAFFR